MNPIYAKQKQLATVCNAFTQPFKYGSEYVENKETNRGSLFLLICESLHIYVKVGLIIYKHYLMYCFIKFRPSMPTRLGWLAYQQQTKSIKPNKAFEDCLYKAMSLFYLLKPHFS